MAIHPASAASPHHFQKKKLFQNKKTSSYSLRVCHPYVRTPWATYHHTYTSFNNICLSHRRLIVILSVWFRTYAHPATSIHPNMNHNNLFQLDPDVHCSSNLHRRPWTIICLGCLRIVCPSLVLFDFNVSMEDHPSLFDCSYLVYGRHHWVAWVVNVCIIIRAFVCYKLYCIRAAHRPSSTFDDITYQGSYLSVTPQHNTHLKLTSWSQLTFQLYSAYPSTTMSHLPLGNMVRVHV